MLKQSSAGVVVYRIGDDGMRTYLLLQYPRGPWDFPKGKLKEGETWKQGALREAKEETGIDPELHPHFEHAYSYSQEHVDYLWLPYHQARMQLPFENVKYLLDQVENFLDLS